VLFPRAGEVLNEIIGQLVARSARPARRIAALSGPEQVRRSLFLDCSFSFAHACTIRLSLTITNDVVISAPSDTAHADFGDTPHF
jgi:hypothetical protein